MKKEYDFSNSVKNPYAKHLKKQVTLRLGVDVISYFKNLAEETGIPYQNLINLYLQDCAHAQKKLRLKWVSATKKVAEQVDCMPP
ncbi:antitoxin [Desulfomarina profundi]|uniref:Antitoxin n=1 Tax=Desulfomarina profundi TaxID=2772557 RepID=A0A8D5FKU2_9BACT|nr:CopG family antitoxin [Desulfomarina profundi]BCL60044.1 antitoxin [Desulfomarina profundi]